MDEQRITFFLLSPGCKQPLRSIWLCTSFWSLVNLLTHWEGAMALDLKLNNVTIDCHKLSSLMTLLSCLRGHPGVQTQYRATKTILHRWINLQPMSVLTVYVQHEFNSNANTYSICSVRVVFIFDEPSMLHGDNFSHRSVVKVCYVLNSKPLTHGPVGYWSP